VHPFARGQVEQIGGAFVSVQLGTLDDATPAELIAAPVRYAKAGMMRGGTRPRRRAISDDTGNRGRPA
jgi:hypothetical protein